MFLLFMSLCEENIADDPPFIQAFSRRRRNFLIPVLRRLLILYGLAKLMQHHVFVPKSRQLNSLRQMNTRHHIHRFRLRVQYGVKR